MDELQITKNNKSRHTGMFQPGVSGNPSGRPKSDANIKELAKAHTQQALDTLVEIAGNKNASPSARVQAATAILDRGWGKPSQHLAVSTAMTFTEYLDMLAEEDAMEMKLKALPADIIDV
jgi:hypothetical protein